MIPLWALPLAAASWDIHWGALHEHTSLSRPTYSHTPQVTFQRMKDQGLSFGAVTDYDWRLAEDGTWPQVAAAVDEAHAPGVFVSLLAYEWNNSAEMGEEGVEYGHRNVYVLDPSDPDGPYGLRASLVPAGSGRPGDGSDGWTTSATPCDLWSGWADSGFQVLTVPHHPALSVTGTEGEDEGGSKKPTSTDWSWRPSTCPTALDDAMEPLVEVFSVWGSGERQDMPTEEDPEDGQVDPARVVREVALGQEGLFLGFLAAGDAHYGWPGQDPPHSFVQEPDGTFRGYQFPCAAAADCDLRFGHTGLAAVLLPAGTPLSREAIFQALAARHTVATTGERFLLRVEATLPDGSTALQGDALETRPPQVRVTLDLGDHSVDRLERVVLSSSDTWTVEEVTSARGLSQGSFDVEVPADARALYLRVLAAPVGALKVPEGLPPLPVQRADGITSEVTVPGGSYTAQTLSDALESAFSAAAPDLDWSVTFADSRFTLAASQPDTGEPVGLRLVFTDVPDLALALGFRDDESTPKVAGESCAPCTGVVDVEGDPVTEMAWASPLWFADPQDTGTGPARRCGCQAGSGLGARAWILALLAGAGIAGRSSRRRRAEGASDLPAPALH